MTDIVSLGAERGTYHLNAAKHNVVLADKTFHGEIKVGITFTATQVCTVFVSKRHAHGSRVFGGLALSKLIECVPPRAEFLSTRQFLIGCLSSTPDFRFRKMEEQLEGGGTVHSSFNNQ